MPKRKICTVITARPSYSRIKTALEAIKAHPGLELQLVVAGSALLGRYGNAVEIIEKDGFEIKDRVYTVLEGENPATMAKTTGLAVMELATVFNNLKPDAVLVIADRFETIAVSIAASYQNISLVHIQGGEVTGNIDEKVRHANTKLADVHFTASENARERVIKLGEDPDYVLNLGCPSIDLAARILQSPELDFDVYGKYYGVGASPDYSKGYLVVLQHPDTNEYDKSRQHIEETLHAINDIKLPTFWFWPNVDAGSDGTSTGIRSFRERFSMEHVHFFKKMEPEDFLRLLVNCQCLLGNSSVGIRECAYLGVPAVNIGNRQRSRERGGNTKEVGYDRVAITAAVQQILQSKRPEKSLVYGGGNAGKLMAETLATINLPFHKTIMY